jgi:hypothetical protein
MLTLRARIPPPEVLIAVRCPPTVALLGFAAALLYAASFFLPAVDGAAGYQAFVLSLVFIIGIPMWLANPVFWSGLTLLSQGKYASAGKTGLLALVLALSECWLFNDLRVGYYAWVGSIALLAAAGWWGSCDAGLSTSQGVSVRPPASRPASRRAVPPAGLRGVWMLTRSDSKSGQHRHLASGSPGSAGDRAGASNPQGRGFSSFPGPIGLPPGGRIPGGDVPGGGAGSTATSRQSRMRIISPPCWAATRPSHWPSTVTFC